MPLLGRAHGYTDELLWPDGKDPQVGTEGEDLARTTGSHSSVPRAVLGEIPETSLSPE